MNPTTIRLLAAAGALALATACAPTRLTTEARLPEPLVEKLPVRIGIYYSKEFREYVHKETRGQVDYEVTLGPAHVTNLDWLLKAMFQDVVPVEDPARAGEVRPPLAMVLEPRFEEYSFLTPKDVAGEAFIVTIRYLLTVYDGGGARMDAYTFTGYGREAARTLSSKEPLAIATQRAMRDAGAKVAVELPDQDTIRLLVRNPYGQREQLAPAPAAVQGTGSPPSQAATQGSSPSESAPGEAAPEEAAPEEVAPEEAASEEAPPAESPAQENPPPPG
ncbi:MAG TPA: hypothetical protein VLA56_18565 [Pseudomonadales bacterium]|nr:hypothetical protein [Pseudomonadales bacterium]